MPQQQAAPGRRPGIEGPTFGSATRNLLDQPLAVFGGRRRGRVIDVDQSAGEITIRHGPIQEARNASWMTMVFCAGEPTTLKQVKPGDRVKFDAQVI
jgi:Cu/Ag efflux protein CusF